MYYVCKMCGRSMRSEEKPNWCYFDRSDSIEGISDEDAVKMGLDIPDGETFEFPGDVRWDPDSGEGRIEPRFIDLRVGLRQLPHGGIVSGKTLAQFQDKIMAEVR